MLLLLLLLWGKTLACSRDDLEMVQIVSKHCSTAPASVYPKDPNSATVWAEGLNDLTMLGKFQAYALGVFLRNYYSDFITSDPRELEVISAAHKETVKSAQSLVTALYSPNPYWEVVQNFSWQPIYIKYDMDNDQFLSNRVCPSADVELKQVASSDTPAVIETYQDFLQYWSAKSGKDLKSIFDVEELFDILLTELAHNFTIPVWSQTYWSEMKYLHDFSVSLKTNTTKLIRLYGGPLLDQIIRTMREKKLNEQKPKKVVFYASHAVPLLGLMAAFGIKESDNLPPCSTLLMELYKTEGEHLVRFLFLNSTTPQRGPQNIYLLKVPGCMELCPLDYIIDYTKNMIPNNWTEDCLQMPSE